MYKKSTKGWMKHLDFIVLDLVSLFLAYLLAYIVRMGIGNPLSSQLYINTTVVLSLISFIVALSLETFKGVLKRGYYIEVIKTAKQVAVVTVMASFYLFIIKSGGNYSRLLLFYNAMFYFLISFITRTIRKEYLVNHKVNRDGNRGLLIVTTDELMEKTLDNVQNNNYEGFQIVGLAAIDKDLVGQTRQGLEIVANRESVIEYACHEWIDEVLISIPLSEANCEDLIEKFNVMGIPVHQKVRSNYGNEKAHTNEFVENLGGYTVITSSVNTATAKELILKRAMDILGGLVGCIIAGFLYLILGPIIYMKSPGPIFFQQERVGKNGRRFKIYKFRSMYLDAEERKKDMMDQNEMSDGMMFKVKWDTRIIGSEKGPDKGIGNFIRKYSLDEWPQFYNILVGDMSLVGTRPPTLDEWERYEIHHRARLATKPGLTGMWQVSGRSNITDFEEVVALDMKYIKEWTFGLDVKILCATVLSVLKHDGAM